MRKLVTLALITSSLLAGAGWLLFTEARPAFAREWATISACCGMGLGGYFLWLYSPKFKRSGRLQDEEWRRIEQERYLLAKEAILEGARKRGAARRQRIIQ